MARPKGSTNKNKARDLPVGFKEIIKTAVTLKKDNIQLCGLRFNHEDQNHLVDKLNEVITYINNE